MILDWDKTSYPKIHGWIFDLKTGKLIDLQLKMEEAFKEVEVFTI